MCLTSFQYAEKAIKIQVYFSYLTAEPNEKMLTDLKGFWSVSHLAVTQNVDMLDFSCCNNDAGKHSSGK